MLNVAAIMGRLTADIEVRNTTNSKVANFTVAVERDFKDKQTGERQVDWIDCVAWGAQVDFLEKYFHKGSLIVVKGRIQTRSYEDKSGNKRKAVEINCESINFGGSKESGGSAPAAPVPEGFAPSEDAEELPF